MSHTFAYQDIDGKVREYDVHDLWIHTAHTPVIDINLELVIGCINDYVNSFTPDDWDRVLNADLSYPIIINDISGIVDGCHRTVKAVFLGYTSISAKRLVEFPTPNRVWKDWMDYDLNY